MPFTNQDDPIRENLSFRALANTQFGLLHRGYNWIFIVEPMIYQAKDVDPGCIYDGILFQHKLEVHDVQQLPKPCCVENEVAALKSGLAITHVLNRTLILPMFHCNLHTEYPLHTFFKIRFFDKSFEEVIYSKLSFLTPIPESVKHSVFTVNQTVSDC